MLGLELRQEFQENRLKGTAIDLTRATAQTPAADGGIRAAADTARRLFKKHQARLAARDSQGKLFQSIVPFK